jgi:hypothetical protein
MEKNDGDTILGLSLSSISLGAAEETLIKDHHMRKVEGSEMHLLQQTGMMVGPQESVYIREPVGLIGPEWDPLVVVIKRRVKMISIQKIAKDEYTKDLVWDDALILYTHELGGPTGRTNDRLVWELSVDRKVIIEKRELFGGTGGRAVTIILSCEDPENLPPTSE